MAEQNPNDPQQWAGMPPQTDPKEGTSAGPGRELQRQERRDLEKQASRFLKRLQLPIRVLDEFQRLKNYLLFERQKGVSGNAIAMTSAWPREGVSFVAFHTAVSLAKGLENSVLLIDANFRNPRLHTFFSNPNAVGLSDILTSGLDVHRAIRPTYMPYLAFLPSGGPVVDPAQHFRSDRFKDFMVFVRAHFDYVIIDTPAVSRYADSLVMGSRVDHVVLVVRAHRTKTPIVEHAKEQIAKHGGKLMGVVLNQRRFFIPKFIYNRL